VNRTLAIALAAVLCGLGVAAIALTGEDVDFRPVWAIAAPAVGWSFIATGLYAWRARPDNRVGMLMVLLGFAWFNYTLLNADSALVFTWSAVTGGLWGSLFLHLGISFPSGVVRPGSDRALVIAGYVIFPLAFVPTMFFNGEDPRNLLLIEPDDALADVMRVVGAAVYTVLFMLVVVRSAHNYRRADNFERLQLAPVYAFALLTFALVTFAQAGVGDPAWFAAFLSSALMPFAFIVGLTRSRLSHLDAELRESLEELRASRARLVEAGDAARRKLERDLHDGAQSRLVALALTLRAARRRAGDDEELARLLDQAQDELKTSLAELRELARGIHPAVLTERGLEAAVQTLVARAPVPVTVDAEGTGRLPAPVESAAYFVVSEGLANVAKYANASHASVAVRCVSDRVTVEVADDGVGGADTANGSGLRGLADRVAALDGTLTLESPAGRGTHLRAEIPVT
jgi:signal transduction histidine kinase